MTCGMPMMIIGCRALGPEPAESESVSGPDSATGPDESAARPDRARVSGRLSQASNSASHWHCKLTQ